MVLPSRSLIAEVESLFCGPRAPHGRYTLPAGELGEVIIPDTLYRFRLLDEDRQAVTLQLYKGIKTLGGALWTREIRALLRVSSRSHPAIPDILGGAYVEASDLAFVLTEAARDRLSDPGAMAFIASRPEQALRQLAMLAHGLSLLHEQGISHRNLHPGAIEYVEYGRDQDDREPRFALRLTRFEMSAMISNLVRRQLTGERLPIGDLRQLYRDSAADTLAYCPPERAAWLFGADDSGPLLDSDRSDIYSLGVLAWRWLVEAQSERDASYAEDQRALGGLIGSLDSIRAFNDHLRRRLRDPRVSTRLAELLRAMLAWDPRDRPSIYSVLQTLTQDYGTLLAGLKPAEETRTYYIGYMPVESKKTVYKWGWIDQDPEQEEGREQLRALLAAELRCAELLYCPEGFAGYQRPHDEGERRSFQAAKYVLAGKQAYWFCELYFQRGPAYSNRQDLRVEQLLVIKYVIAQRRAWRLAETPLRRRIPGEVRLLPVLIHRPLDLTGIRDGAPWPPLLRSVEFTRNTPDWMQRTDDAFSFLLEFRRAELDGRSFPFEVVRRAGLHVDLRVDSARDRHRTYEDSLRSLYFREMREPMGRLFQALNADDTSPLALYADFGGRPDFRGDPVAKAVFERRLDDDTISIRVVHGAYVPEHGWIRPSEDGGSHAQLHHQEEAVQELLRARALLHQLHAPTAIKGMRHRWSGVGGELMGRSPDIVKDMLTSEPFYALHGPPGTGKTTVAAVAVAAHLRADPSQRVLISSQSHYALDNLARRVVDRCKAERLDIVAVRVASDHTVAEKKVHPSIEALLPERLARTSVDLIQREARKALNRDRLADGRPLDGPLRGLLSEWEQQAPRVELEIKDRIRRGANLVFATTGGCTPRNVATGGTQGLYDWVIVEEAARAWPSELAMPLVRGLRWTLIGDHYQLSAFDELSIGRFLQHCQDSPDEELQTHGSNRGAYLEVFRLFGSMFDKRVVRRAGRPRSARLVEPLDELDLQFRMHSDICRIVSRAFYRARVDARSGELREHPDGWLQAHREKTDVEHVHHHPAFLKGRAIVWLDTEGFPDSEDQRAWYNEGEVNLIKTLLARLRPAPPPIKEGGDDDHFALLSPYSDQIDAFRRVDLPAWTSGRLHTVDSFQGREADVVVVSLVRSTQRADRRPEANIGYLVSPNRVNVLLSRARRLLVVVGRLRHFERQVELNPDRPDIAFWKEIAEEVRRQRAVVDARARLGDDL